MKRTLADVAELAELRPNVRVCKGIYVEPPEVAFQEFETVRLNFVEAVGALLDRGRTSESPLTTTGSSARPWPSSRKPPRAGPVRVPDAARRAPGARGRARPRGHRLRIYVPYGRQWYEYSLRRLQENPKIAGYIAVDTLKRLKP